MSGLQVQIQELLARNRFNDARGLLEQAFRAGPDATAHVLAAQVEHRSGNLDEARSQVEQGLALEPENRDARVVLFRILEDQKQYPEAEQIMLGLIRETPLSGELYALLAGLNLKLLQLDHGKALLAEALRLDPSSDYARILDTVVAIIESRWSDGAHRLRELVSESPDALHVSWTLLAALSSQHRYREALELGRAMLLSTPQDSELVKLLVELRAASHWTMAPLRPLLRHQWVGSAMLWAGMVVCIFVLRPYLPTKVLLAVLALWIGFVIYTWVYPPLLKRWLQVRGF